MSVSLEVADGLGHYGVDIGSKMMKRLAGLLSGLAGWWVEDIAGGIYEGFGDGMAVLGVVQAGSGSRTGPDVMTR